jgi:hypothetical protein
MWPGRVRLRWHITRRTGYLLAIVLALAVFSISFVWQIQKNPLRLDEVEYFQCIDNLTHLGVPFYYAGQVDLDHSQLIHLSTRWLQGAPYDFYRFKPETGIVKETFFALTADNGRYTYGMWHPPLYIYLGALFFRLFPLTPETSTALRYFNLLFAAGTFAGIYALAHALYGRRGLPVTAAALTLYALNSLATRGALLIDYNATLGPCAAVWFAFTYIRAQQRPAVSRSLILATAFAFFTSLGIGVCLVSGTLAHSVLVRRAVRPWRVWIALALGVVVFLLLFLAFCALFNLPFTQPFLHNLQRLTFGPGATPHSLLDWATVIWTYLGFFGREIGYTTLWIAAALGLTQLYRRQLLQTSERSYLPLMTLMSFIAFAALRGDAYGFPKYILFALPLLFVFLAGEGLAVIVASRTLAWPWRALTATALPVVALVSGLHSLAVARMPGSTLFNPGEQGITAAAQALHDATTTDEVVLSDRDVAFFAGRKYVGWSFALMTDADALHTRVSAEQVRYVVVRAGFLQATSPNVSAYLQENFVEKNRDADFALLQGKSASQRATADAALGYGLETRGRYSP